MLLTRPYEGVLLLLPLAIALLVTVGPRPGAADLARRVALPAMIALLPTGLFLGVYNHAVTGGATHLPYVVYEARYNPAPLFIWQQPRAIEPSPREELRRLAEWNLGIYERAGSPRGLGRKARQILGLAASRRDARDLATLVRTGFGVLLLLSVPIILGDRRMRVPLLRPRVLPARALGQRLLLRALRGADRGSLGAGRDAGDRADPGVAASQAAGPSGGLGPGRRFGSVSRSP